MKFRHYLKDNLLNIVLNMIILLMLNVFLLIIGNSLEVIYFFILFWILSFFIKFLLNYYIKKQYLDNLMKHLNNLEEKYLIAEVIEKPKKYEDKLFWNILKICEKDMLQKILNIKNERKEYKEYVEQWIHEIKTPIAAIKLICENNKKYSFIKDCILEIIKIDNISEQVLYYARSENVEKDYFIHQILLEDIIHNVIYKNKYLLIQNNISVNLENCNVSVYSDEKWIEFILNQIIINSIKYKNEDCKILFSTENFENKIILNIEDNGIGIKSSDLPKVFQKGFTGENGRINNHSTGIGLYLCKKMCDKLGIGIKAISSENYTCIKLIFNINDFIQR